MEALFIPLGIFALLALGELVLPNRRFPQVARWRLKGGLGMCAYLALASTAPLLWDTFLDEHRLIDARQLGTAWGALLGLLAYELVAYWYHRAVHKVDFLWRWLHQMHHSAERIDVYGAFWFHPFDMLGFTFCASFAMVFLFGLTPEAAGIAAAISVFLAVFQHMNVRTPAWLGYLIHRPEQHSLHHQRGVHGFNYGSLALWDQVFGTFRNPETWEAEAGLYDGASARVGDMLLGRDVSKPRERSRISRSQPMPT